MSTRFFSPLMQSSYIYHSTLFQPKKVNSRQGIDPLQWIELGKPMLKLIYILTLQSLFIFKIDTNSILCSLISFTLIQSWHLGGSILGGGLLMPSKYFACNQYLYKERTHHTNRLLTISIYTFSRSQWYIYIYIYTVWN
jgi:hypothetical protein